jgi:hypothetical protein
MEHLQPNDILTRVARYNLIRDQRLVYIDVHEALHGRLAGPYVAVPNLVNIIAKQEYQGVGQTEAEALADCLAKIKAASIEKLFPRQAGEKKAQS